jgi:integral membrane protein (TIGR01906 family)
MLTIARITLIITLPLVLLFSSLQALVFQPAYFSWQFERYHIEEATGMEKEDLLDTMDEVMAYLQGKRDDLVIISRVRGMEREIFGEREKDHMVDVQNLFLAGFWIRNISLLLLLASLYTLYRKGSGVLTARAVAFASWLPLSLGLVLGLVVSLDFSRYFVIFHEIFFDNDLWLLNPNTDILIQMLPEGFFMDTALLATVLFVFLSLCIGTISLFYYQRLQPRP